MNGHATEGIDRVPLYRADIWASRASFHLSTMAFNTTPAPLWTQRKYGHMLDQVAASGDSFRVLPLVVSLYCSARRRAFALRIAPSSRTRNHRRSVASTLPHVRVRPCMQEVPATTRTDSMRRVELGVRRPSGPRASISGVEDLAPAAQDVLDLSSWKSRLALAAWMEVLTQMVARHIALLHPLHLQQPHHRRRLLLEDHRQTYHRHQLSLLRGSPSQPVYLRSPSH